MEFFLLWIGINFIIGYAIGKTKGREMSFALVCVALGPIGWIICLFVPARSQHCPYCAEMVKREARACPYCGHDIDSASARKIPRGRSGPPRLFEKYNLRK